MNIFRWFSNLKIPKLVEVKPRMTIPVRSILIPATGLLSSYKKKKDPSQRWDVSVFKEGANIAPDMFDALVKLSEAVSQQNGTLYITDLFRPWEVQERNRNDYLSGKKKAFAAPPGGSFHQAGRAVDFSTSELNFKGLEKENWLKKFWDLARPLGFCPIIKIPDLNMSECWHMDMVGKDWKKLYEHMDYSTNDCVDYSFVAKCCILDIGKWDPKEDSLKVQKMFIQSQIYRLGIWNIGKLDGIIGNKTKNGLLELGYTGNINDLSAICEYLIKK